MTQLDGSTFLVVGASGVLGQEFVTKLSESGARVLGTAASETSLTRIPPAATDSMVCDLANVESIDATSHAVLTRVQRLDGVIITAGVVAFGPFRATPPEIVDRLMRVNATGPLRLVHNTLGMMTDAESPVVVTLSGKVAEIPTAGLAAYSASKMALYAAASAAARELRRDGIRWMDARPGHTETGLADRAIFGEAPNFGVGHAPGHVADRIIAGIVGDEKDLPSDAF